MSLDGKVCLVTGAASGIGAATAICFAKLGAKLSICDRNSEGLDGTVASCRLSNDKVLAIAIDLACASDRERLIANTIEKFGRLDVLVNNAGIFLVGGLDAPHLFEHYDKVMEINLRAPIHLINLAVPHLIASKGNVVNVSSVNGLRGFPGRMAYNVSKAGIDHVTRCVALELAPKGVRVNSVIPGVTMTGIFRSSGYDETSTRAFFETTKLTHPLSAFTGQPAKPEEVADVIAFLASDSARYISGAHVPADGGRSITCFN